MARVRRLQIELLEDRATPAIFGYPWPTTQPLTLSFVPDGTPIGSAWTDSTGQVHPAPQSQLFSYFASQPNMQNWQQEVLRAVQNWAAQSNINIVVVADSGDPVGTPGLVQGDSRFGDIRISGTPLGSASLANGVPFNPLVGTWAGDVLLNTQTPFSIGSSGTNYDLFSVAIHELGHSFSLEGQLTDTSSVMFDYYFAQRSGLGAADIAAIQDLYGVRQGDIHEGSLGNNTPGTATAITPFYAGEKTILDADLSTISDLDYFRYTPAAGTGSFKVQVDTAAYSLLKAQLCIYDTAGNLLASTGSASPMPQILSLEIATQPGRSYIIRIAGMQNDVFAVGSYRMTIDSNVAPPAWESAYQQLQTRVAMLTAPTLQVDTTAQSGDIAIAQTGTLSRVGEVDYYKLRLPKNSEDINLSLHSAGTAQLSILDTRGNTVATAGGTGGAALSLAPLAENTTYYVAVAGSTSTTYNLQGMVPLPSLEIPVVASGTLSASVAETFRGVLVPVTGMIQFNFDLQYASLMGPTGLVELALFDLNGTLVHRTLASIGETTTLNLLLLPGAYTWRMTAGTADGSPLQDVTFAIRSMLASDPIGPRLINPGQVPTREVKPTWYDLGFFVQITLIDPYGRAISPITPPPVVVLPPNLIPKP